ncbi:MAG: lamin tail domain-containing protein [Deltaproteobacteria bacterium]|nr:lamin tail domain-containing protein [Deltaproteobacteria bacterium]
MLTLLALFTLLTSGCSQADKVTDDSAPPEGDADADSDSDSDSDADADADSDSDSDADPPEAKLVLNELVAGNETGATDEAGQNEDWIELLNIGDAAAELTGWGLTDALGEKEPWRFPEAQALNPGERLLIWADEDIDDGPNHADFKLSGDGETLSLVNPDDELIDAVSFPALNDDQAYARLPDGEGAWDLSDTPTPGAENK